jgi:methylisocitrate lyase
LSARIVEAEGYEAIVAGGYAGIGSMLAQADMGQSNARDYADHYARICNAVDIPVYVDADTGFGGVHNIRETVRAFEAAGVAGLFVGDQTFPQRCGYLPGKQVVSVEQMLTRLKAALDARRDANTLIAARTDARNIIGLDEAIARCQLFMEAGADMATPQGVDSIEEIKRVIREVKSPHMANISQAAGRTHRSLAELEEAGVSAVIFPSLALFAAAHAVRGVLRALKRDNGLANVGDDLMSLDDYYDLVGLNAQMAREERYDREAAAMSRRREAAE